MEIAIYFAFALVGIIAGLVAGMLGLSGGVVTVPCLVLIFTLMGFPQAHLMHVAIGTSLAAMVINGISSTMAHHKRGGVMWDVVFLMIPGLFLGSLSGTFLASFLSGIVLQVFFGFFVACLGAYVLLQKKKKRQEKAKKVERTLYTWVGLGIGFLASLLGIGGGVFLVPLLLAQRTPEKKAVGTSAAMGLFVTFLAAFGYLYFGRGVVVAEYVIGYIYIPAFLTIGLITIFFAPIGAKLAHKMDPKKLRRIFAATLILVGILMVFS